MATRLHGLEDASPEEAAAILAALSACMEEVEAFTPSSTINLWALAGRLEAQRPPLRRDQLTERWHRR